MSSYKEIVTKAIISKGKKSYSNDYVVAVDNKPSTILGCWVINHKFGGNKTNDKIIIDGSYDVNIWYSYDNDSKTDVVRESNTYHEVINMRDREENVGEEVIVRSLRQPSCVNIEIDNNNIKYTIEKELGVELVGDIKVKIEANDEEEPWDEIVEDNKKNDIDEVKEDFIKEETI